MSTRLPKTTTEFYDDLDPTICQDRPGYYEVWSGVKYGWNGLPVESSYELDNAWMIGATIGEGLFELSTSLGSSIVVWRNPSLSKAIKFYLLFYCGYLGIDGLYFFYMAYCSTTYDCVNPSGYPFSGLLLNMIITAFCGGMSVTNTFIDIGLSINRFFAVFFNVSDKSNGFICYMGAYLDPSWLATSLCYLRFPFLVFLVEVYSMSVIVVMALTFDVATVWKLKKMKFTSETKGRRDRKLMAMVILIHFFSLIAMVDAFALQNPNMERSQRLVYVGLPQFLCRCTVGFVLIGFSWRSPCDRKKSTKVLIVRR
ncbi:unnamed protein product, partial [Mesorhabditis belari]|uniref:Uncharacterized protein n=1 Tax=Mesorhabditis belari TaxID=2138241 RepID=A0AAF3EAH8_9BILA